MSLVALAYICEGCSSGCYLVAAFLDMFSDIFPVLAACADCGDVGCRQLCIVAVIVAFKPPLELFFALGDNALER